MGRRVVYISYDGMEDPLGKSQVLPYLEALAARGHQFELVSFEKPPHATHFRKVVSDGIRSTRLRYHKTPTVPATAFDMAAGVSAMALLSILHKADLVHVRSYVPGVIALPWTTLAKCPLLFDMRGFWADERLTASGPWGPSGPLYLGAKAAERALLQRARGVVVLTNSMARYLRQEAPFRAEIAAPIRVIPTCADLNRFSPSVEPHPETAQRVKGCHTLIYLGSVGARYRSREMAQFYVAWRQAAPPARFLVVSRQEPTELRQELAAAGVAEELVHVSAQHHEVPSLIRCADAGILLYSEVFASRGVAPTKLGELLGVGIPAAGNAIADVPEVLAEDTGVLLRSLEPHDLLAGAAKLAELARQPGIADRTRRTAERWFSLDRGAAAYDRLYNDLTGPCADQGWPE